MLIAITKKERSIMNTTHLQSFIYVAKYNSISKAAQKLNYSNSTVQSHIRALESELNTKLYERTNSGIYLTDKGILFLEYANKLLDVVSDIHNAFNVSENILRITASEMPSTYVINSLIYKLINKYPNIEIKYTKATTDVAIEKITSNRCDVSFIAEPHFNSAKVASKFLCKLPLSFVTSPTHICFKKGLANTKHNNTLLCTMPIATVNDLLQTHDLQFSDFFYSEKNIGDLQTIKELACEGHVITLIPTHLVEKELATNKLAIIPELDYEFTTNMYLLASKEHSAKQELINDLLELLPSLL